jgi:subtilisin family serine protease
MDNTRDREVTVVVDDGGVLARWADWHARTRRMAVAALGRTGAPPMMFATDEVLVHRGDRDLIEELVRMGAVVVPERPLLPPPDGVRPRQLAEDFPLPVKLRFPQSPRGDRAVDTLTELMRRRDDLRGEATFTSPEAATLAYIVARYAAEGRRIGLNVLGSPAALPLSSAEEGDGADPFDWDAFKRARIVEAWQLVESRRAIGSVEPVVWIAILDGGFWLDPAGVPLGQPSDFGAGVPQVNLIDEGANASGTNPVNCENGDCPWHGNHVASAATAGVGNKIGAAGSGGTVARPIFFRSRMTKDETLRCLKYCTAWGIDILNMSFKFECVEFFFDTSGWNDAFTFAIANGVVPVAAAGNQGRDLPDYNIRPATRTPGAITVGALDGDNAAGYSNYGSSISIWSPAILPVTQDDAPNLSLSSGTSIAAPIVSGVAAMMRAVNPGLNAIAIRQIMIDTGRPGTGRVSKALDAYAAVLAAMGNRLDDFYEPNDTRQSARELSRIGPNLLGPAFSGLATRSGAGDDDWWRFTVTEFTQATIRAECYPRLGPQLVELSPDDPNSAVMEDIAESHGGGVTTFTGILAPDTYRIRISGNRPSLYELKVTTKPARLTADQFETNDSFDAAAALIFKPRTGLNIVWREWGPGTFRATLHQRFNYITGAAVMDVDYFRLEVPRRSVFSIPTVKLFDCDAPVTAELYNDAQVLLNQWPPTRGPLEIQPPGESICYLKISSPTPTRYRIAVYLGLDEDIIPGPHQRPFELFPPWWIHDPLRLVERITDYYVDVGADRALGDRLVFQNPGQPVAIDLVDTAGNVVRSARPSATGGIELDVRGLDRAGYLVRVTRTALPADSGRAKPLNLRLAPPIG